MIEYTAQQLEDIITTLDYQIADKEELIRYERGQLSSLQVQRHNALTKLAYLKGVEVNGHQSIE